MLDLDSARWAEVHYAYGDGTDLPPKIIALQHSLDGNWRDLAEELFNDIRHQGDVYPATYPVLGHLLKLAHETRPSELASRIVATIGSTAGAAELGPPDFLEDDWIETQEEAFELMLVDLETGCVPKGYLAEEFVAGVLNLLGEFAWGKVISCWFRGQRFVSTCPACGVSVSLCEWGDDTPRVHTEYVDTQRPCSPDFWPSAEVPVRITSEFEFDDDRAIGQILGIADATRDLMVVSKLRLRFGTRVCECEEFVSLI